MLLTCKDIQKSYGVETVLENVSFFLENGEKAAIVGINGAGKTTLFKLLTDETPPDGGTISLSRIGSECARLGYLPQVADFDSQNTIYTEMMSVFDDVIAIEAEMRSTEREMGRLSGDALASAMSRYDKLTADFERHNGYEIQSRIRGIIKGLGFAYDESPDAQPVSTLSGGQKTRVALGKLLLSAPDLLLLDEPTNHLDIESIEWLEGYLSSYTGGVLLISHDRYFIDRVVTKVIEIENKVSTVYNGNYTIYAQKKAEDRQIQLKHYVEQQKEIKRQEEIIKMYKAFNTEASHVKARSREKMLARIERVEKPEEISARMRLLLKPKRESGNDVLTVDQLSKAFDSNKLFEQISFAIKKGEKVALIGPNGIGKTTLINIVIGKHQADNGEVTIGANVKIGYYAQEHDIPDSDKSIFEDIGDSYPRLTNGEIRNVLAAFMFTGDDVFKSVSNLSGGEKGRVTLAKIMLGGANFLILDEPTNHLDLYSKEVLEGALKDYPGTVLYISHDRYFINNTAERIIELSQTGVKTYLGNYDYYLEKKKTAEAYDVPTDAPTPETPKNSWQQKRIEEAEERRHRKRLEQTEQNISKTEEQIKALEDRLLTDEVSTNHELAAEVFEQKTALEEALNKLYEEWSVLMNEKDI